MALQLLVFTEPRCYEPCRSSPSHTEPGRATPVYIQPYWVTPSRTKPCHFSSIHAPSHASSHRTTPGHSEPHNCDQAHVHVTLATPRASSADVITDNLHVTARLTTRPADHLIALVVSQLTTLRTTPPMLRTAHMFDYFSPTLRSWSPIHLRWPGSRLQTSPAISLQPHPSLVTYRGIRWWHRSWTTSCVNYLAKTPRQKHWSDSDRQPPFCERVYGVSGHPKERDAAQVPTKFSLLQPPEKATTHSKRLMTDFDLSDMEVQLRRSNVVLSY